MAQHRLTWEEDGETCKEKGAWLVAVFAGLGSNLVDAKDVVKSLEACKITGSRRSRTRGLRIDFRDNLRRKGGVAGRSR